MTVDYKSTPVQAAVYGEGPPVVLLHGFLENKKIWEGFIAKLKVNNRVICPDLFGHGQTPRRGDIHSMEEMAESVAAVLDALKIESAALVGHSMGGYVAMAFAEKFPERLMRLLLLNSSPQPDSDERLKGRDQAIRVVRKHKKAFLRSSIGNLFADENRKRYEPVLEQHVAEGMEMETAGIVASLKGMKARKDRTAVLKTFPRLKWIVAGKADPIIPLKGLEEIAAETEAELFALPGGHLSYIEEKRKVEKVLAEFLV